MKFRVLINTDADGGFWATVPALPGCVTEGDSREEVVRNIHEAVESWLEVANEDKADAKPAASGELLTLDFETNSLSDLAGTYRDDPDLQDICDDIYRERDAEPKE